MSFLSKNLTDQDLLYQVKVNFPNLIFNNNKFWDYKGGIYRPIEDEVVKNMIFTVLIKNKEVGKKANAKLIDNVYRLAKTVLIKEGKVFDLDPAITVFKNCVLNLSTLRQRKHSPEYRSTIQLPYDYNPNAKCPNFERLLAHFPPRVVNFLQEYAGHCISSDYNREISVWLLGSSGSGKSTFLEGLRAAYGDYMAPINPKDMSEDKYWLSTLLGKRVVYSTEMADTTWRNNTIYNQLVSEEEVVVQIKYLPSIRVRFRFRFFFAMNVLPEIFYVEDGLWRRIQIVRVPDLLEAQRDSTLKQKVMGEAPGIMNWAIRGLRRLRNRGYFEIPEEVQKEKEKQRRKLFDVDEFINEKCTKLQGSKTQAADLVETVNKFCDEKGIKPPTPQEISKSMEEQNVRKTTQKGRRFYHDISLN